MVSSEKDYALAALFGVGRRELIEHTPHCGRLAMEVVHSGPNEATVKIPYREELVGDPVRGVVFGGVITTLLDHASGLAVFCSLSEIKVIATLDLRIDYLRAAEPGLDLIGHAQCYKVRKHVAFVRGTAYDRSPDDPFASCQASFMLGAPSETLMARAARVLADKPT